MEHKILARAKNAATNLHKRLYKQLVGKKSGQWKPIDITLPTLDNVLHIGDWHYWWVEVEGELEDIRDTLPLSDFLSMADLFTRFRKSFKGIKVAIARPYLTLMQRPIHFQGKESLELTAATVSLEPKDQSHPLAWAELELHVDSGGLHGVFEPFHPSDSKQMPFHLSNKMKGQLICAFIREKAIMIAIGRIESINKKTRTVTIILSEDVQIKKLAKPGK